MFTWDFNAFSCGWEQRACLSSHPVAECSHSSGGWEHRACLSTHSVAECSHSSGGWEQRVCLSSHPVAVSIQTVMVSSHAVTVSSHAVTERYERACLYSLINLICLPCVCKI